MAERLADRVWRLELGLVPPLASNAYLLVDGDVTLVDAGLPFNRPPLRREIESTGHQVGELDRVLVTHYDLDHVGGLARLDVFDGPVYMGDADVRLLTREWNPPSFHHKGLFHRVARRLFPLRSIDLRGVEDGETVGGFVAYHTPGHNPGHTVYVHEDLDVGLLGDLVWENGGRFTPPFWLDSYDMRQLRESIRRLVERAPEFDLACVAHGQPLRGGSDALRELVAQLRR